MNLLAGFEVDAQAAGEELASVVLGVLDEPGVEADLEILAELARGPDSILARRATLAAGALAGRLSGKAGLAERASAVVWTAAHDARYRVRLAAAVACDDLPPAERDAARLALLRREDGQGGPSDEDDRGNYIVQAAVLKGLDPEDLRPDAAKELWEAVRTLSESSPSESVKNEARRALGGS